MPVDMDSVLAGMVEMRMRQAAAVVVMRRLGVERLDVSRSDVTESAGFDVRFRATADGFSVELVAPKKSAVKQR